MSDGAARRWQRACRTHPRAWLSESVLLWPLPRADPLQVTVTLFLKLEPVKKKGSLRTVKARLHSSTVSASESHLKKA